MSNQQRYTVASSNVWVVPFAVKNNWWIVRLLNRSLFFWRHITFTQQMEWSSQDHSALSFEVVVESEQTLLAAFGLKNLCRFSEYEAGTLYTLLCKYPSCFPCFFFHAQSPFERSFLECWSVCISLILKSGLDDSKCRSYFFCSENTLVREMMKSHSVLGLGICRSSNDGMWRAIDAEYSFASAGIAVCLHAHLSPNLQPPGALNFVHSGQCQKLHECSFGNFLSWSLYKVICLLFLTDFYQQILLCLQHVRHRYFFRYLSNFFAVNLSEKVNEVVPSLCLSCLGHAWMRMLLQMNIGLFWSNGCSLSCRSCSWHLKCLFLSLFLCSELLLKVCPRLGFSLWKKNPRFSARDVIGPTSIWDNHTSCRHVSSPERRRATSISILPTFQFAPCTDCPIWCELVCHVSDCW